MASPNWNQLQSLQVADGLMTAGSACISHIGAENATNGIKYLTDAFHLYKQIFGHSDHEKMADCLHKLGHAHSQLGLPTRDKNELQLGCNFFEASHKMYKNLGNEQLARILSQTLERATKTLQKM